MVIVATVLAGSFALVPTSRAHPELTKTQPSDSSVVVRAPNEVRLKFSERVESAFGAVHVFDPNARRIDEGGIVRPDAQTLVVRTDNRLAPRGTYTVEWRVLGSDSHPVSGVFVFHVGAPGPDPAGIAAGTSINRAHGTVEVLSTVVRFLNFGLLLLVVGGASTVAFLLRGISRGLRRRLLGFLAAASGGLAVVALLAIGLQGSVAAGSGLGGGTNFEIFRGVLETRYGKVLLAQASLATVVAVIACGARRTSQALPPPAFLVLATLLVPTPSLSGHASVSGPVSLAADIAHVAAAAVWAGGLAFLALALAFAGRKRWSLAAHAVPRFATLAAASVALLVAAGTVNAYQQVGSWHRLWQTSYGNLLLGKLTVVLVIIAIGAYNQRYAVPRIRNEIATRAEQRRFLRLAWGELVLVLVVVGITAILVSEPPARANVAHQGPRTVGAKLGDLRMNLLIDPATTGSNAIHLTLTDQAGRPAEVYELEASLSQSARLTYRSQFISKATLKWSAITPLTRQGLPFAGTWQLNIDARRGQSEAMHAKVSFSIRKG